LIYCSAAAVQRHWQECGCALSVGPIIENPNPLSYASWGPWSASGSVSASPTGQLTPPEAMPKTGSAKYVGDAYGLAYGGTVEKGAATIGVGFESGGITVNIDLPSRTIPPATGQIYGAGYTAQGGFTREFENQATTITGAFYGPAASETAGTFTYKKSMFDNMTGQTRDIESLTGSFRAKLCAAGC
jgi:hypothetical protein